jgi:hypothetical protein
MLMFQQYLGVQQFNERNSIKRRPGQGRKRATNAVEDQFLKLYAIQQQFVTARESYKFIGYCT